MVPIAYTVSDASQLKLHVQDDGVAVSFREGEWVLLANRAAEVLRDKLNIIYNADLPDDEDLVEETYVVSYRLPDQDQIQQVEFQATSETDALVQFYDNAPAEYKAKLAKVEVVKKP